MLEHVIAEELLDMVKGARIGGQTLEILYMRMDGYKTEEIAVKLGLTRKAIYRREERLREKIKKLSDLRGK